MPRLFHFSDDPDIRTFEPRPVAVPSRRPAGQEWLNGPLVWAIDEWHQPMYFFPRDCPRILVWPIAETTDDDRESWMGSCEARMVAHVEQDWLEPIRHTRLFRYELPADPFASLGDAGMWISRDAVEPTAVETIHDLPGALRSEDVELRVMPSLVPLRDAWASTAHVSGIRLRNAKGWTA